jgi:hypothetical protein
MRTSQRQRVALAIAVLGTVVGIAPVQTASADPSPPELSLTVPDSIDVNGPAGDVDITLANPPAGDRYLRLDINGEGSDHLRVADDSGAALAPQTTSPGGITTWNIGAEDSDHNGIPGSTLTAGTTHVHIAAGYPVDDSLSISARLVDGATGQLSGLGYGVLFVRQPSFSTSWTSPRYSGGTGSLVTIGNGISEPTEISLRTDMTWMQAPPAATHTRWMFTAQQIKDANFTARELADGVKVQYSTDGSHYTAARWSITEDGSLFLDFPAHTWAADGAAQTETLRITAAWGLPHGTLDGDLQILDADGVQYAGAPESLKFAVDLVPLYARGALYGRDGNGALWQYQEYEEPEVHVLAPRSAVGSGWQTYNALTKMSTLMADGTGDLVARDHDGILWYYRGTGNSAKPFAPRVRVGGGWQIYTALVGAGDLTGDGHPDLIARDSSGTLWLYRGTGNPTTPFATRTRIGGGWNTYTALVAAGDLTGDGHPDLLARDSSGTLWLYAGTGNPTTPFATRTRIGGGWNTYTALLGPGDMLGEGKPDLIARDSSGALWLYAGTGKATAPFRARFKIGTGWNTYNTLF